MTDSNMTKSNKGKETNNGRQNTKQKTNKDSVIQTPLKNEDELISLKKSKCTLTFFVLFVLIIT